MFYAFNTQLVHSPMGFLMQLWSDVSWGWSHLETDWVEKQPSPYCGLRLAWLLIWWLTPLEQVFQEIKAEATVASEVTQCHLYQILLVSLANPDSLWERSNKGIAWVWARRASLKTSYAALLGSLCKMHTCRRWTSMSQSSLSLPL